MTVVGIVRSGFENVTTLIGLEHPKLSNLQFWHDFSVKSSQNLGSEHLASSKAMNVITFFEPVRTIPTTVIKKRGLGLIEGPEAPSGHPARPFWDAWLSGGGFLTIWGAKRGPKGRPKLTKKTKTDAKFRRFFRSPPGAHFRALCAENGAKIDPKWSRNRARERKRRFLENEQKTMDCCVETRFGPSPNRPKSAKKR